MTQTQHKFTDNRNGFSNSKVPTYDFSALFSIGQRNIAALTAANQAFVEGAQAIAKRQTEIAKKSAEGAIQLFRETRSSKTPEACVAKQSEFIRGTCEEALANTRELFEMATKSNVEAAEVLTNRLTEVIGEVSSVAVKGKESGKSSNS